MYFSKFIIRSCVPAGFMEIGGFEDLKQRYSLAIPPSVQNASAAVQQCATPQSNAFHLFRGLDDPLALPGVLFGLTVSGIWYWCTDQVEHSVTFCCMLSFRLQLLYLYNN